MKIWFFEIIEEYGPSDYYCWLNKPTVDQMVSTFNEINGYTGQNLQIGEGYRPHMQEAHDTLGKWFGDYKCFKLEEREIN